MLVELHKQFEYSALQDLLSVQLISDGDITHDTQGRDEDEAFGLSLADLDEVWHEIADLYQFLNARFLPLLTVIGNGPQTVTELILIKDLRQDYLSKSYNSILYNFEFRQRRTSTKIRDGPCCPLNYALKGAFLDYIAKHCHTIFLQDEISEFYAITTDIANRPYCLLV